MRQFPSSEQMVSHGASTMPIGEPDTTDRKVIDKRASYLGIVGADMFPKMASSDFV
jgi:hypothetical protein